MQVDAAKKRVKWLQDRLEKVLLTAKSYCHLYNRSLLRSKVQFPVPVANLSLSMGKYNMWVGNQTARDFFWFYFSSVFL